MYEHSYIILSGVVPYSSICYAVSLMPWYSKEQPTPFDSTPIEGLFFLSGSILAQTHHQEQFKNQKYPLITFPSSLARELADSSKEGGVLHIFSGLQLFRHQSRDQAYVDALQFAEAYGYRVTKHGENELVIANPHSGHGYQIMYDSQRQQIADITRFPEHAMELLDGISRAALPDLYSGEEKGMEAVAPVKFFTPDSGWTWYASEYDGEDTFFGLVSGLEVELGYFSVTELESVRGPLGLPIERDLYYQPQSLRELKDYHTTQ